MRRIRLVVMLVASTSAVGCWESGRIDLYTCDDPCGNGQPGTTCDDPCGDCRGQCVPIAPLDFDGPLMLWTGPENEAPADCPSRAPIRAYEGHGALDASTQCSACECTKPACSFPSGLDTSSQTCVQGAGGTQISFNAPPAWTGACTSPTTVTSNVLTSVTIQPVTERPCEPVPPQVPHGGFGSPWGVYALACAGEIFHGECRDPGMTCVPTAEPPPPGYRQCIAGRGDGEVVCPETYPEPFTFYSGLNDTRECTPCECLEIVASDCQAMVSLYQDTACTTVLLGGYPMGLGGIAPCVDIGMPGAGLGSMETTWIANEPGKCVASGGLPKGEATPTGPKAFCCQPQQ